MARFETFAVGLVLAVAVNFVACSSDQIQTHIEVVENMEKYLEENPGLEVQPLVKEVEENGPLQYVAIKYTLGQRTTGKAFEYNSHSFLSRELCTEYLFISLYSR